MEVSSAVGYRIEGGIIKDDDHHDEGKHDGGPVISGTFDLQDTDYHYYKENFYEKEHMNYLCADSDLGPIAMSVVLADSKYKALTRTKTGNKRGEVSASNIRPSFFRRIFGLGPSKSQVINAFDPALPAAKMKLVNDPRLAQQLLHIEEKQTIKGFKFGIIYAAPGQTKEEEWFANVDPSPEFEEFLDFLGDRIPLNGWTRFRGGLDVTNGSTGETSLFQEWNNCEVMFHVSTLLPFNEQDKQQLERKRHIGNDIVIIIYQDGDTVYRPTTISSRQVHVVFLVKSVMEEGQRKYRLAVISREGVPRFAPDLPQDSIFNKGAEFKDFFYTKLLNAEKACYEAPMLEGKLTRTRDALLKDVAESYP